MAKNNELQYPEMRQELLEYLRGLSDPEYQQRAWVEGCFPKGVEYDCLDFVVHFLYDDTCLARAPESAVGVFLRDESEVAAIRALVGALEVSFKEVGIRGKDSEYLQSRSWPAVIAVAYQALELLRRNDGKGQVTGNAE